MIAKDLQPGQMMYFKQSGWFAFVIGVAFQQVNSSTVFGGDYAVVNVTTLEKGGICNLRFHSEQKVNCFFLENGEL